jgi:hypothetical protein
MVDMFSNFVTRVEFNQFKEETNRRFDNIEAKLTEIQDTLVEMNNRFTTEGIFTKNSLNNHEGRIATLEANYLIADSQKPRG